MNALEVARRTGRWGFSVSALPTPFSLSDLLSVTMDSANAHAWTVHLCAPRYQGDHSAVLTGDGPPPNYTDMRSTYARVQWGVEGVTEEALVDYHAQGCTFGVQAATLRLSLYSSDAADPAQPVPVLSGFLAPIARSDHGGLTVSPTYTTPVVTVLAGGAAIIPRPPRAVAYRWVLDGSSTAVAVSTGLQFEELAGDIVQRRSIDEDSLGIAGGTQYWLQPMHQRAGYMPMMPDAQWVRVINSGLPDPSNVPLRLQFLLDLG